MKCSNCGRENRNSLVKKWTFNVYEVSRFECSECGKMFNIYGGIDQSYTIPKTRN